MTVHSFEDARREREEAVFPDAKLLKRGDGDGTSGDMDGWQQSVETRLTDVGGDVRDLRRWFGGGVILLLSAFAAGFLALQAETRHQADQMDDKLTSIDQRLDKMAESQARIEAVLTERQAVARSSR